MLPGSLPGTHTIATVPDRPDGGGQAAGGDVRTVVAAFLRLDPAAIDPHTPLTAYGRKVDRERSLAAGFNMHVPKPVDPGELTAIIADLADLS